MPNSDLTGAVLQDGNAQNIVNLSQTNVYQYWKHAESLLGYSAYTDTPLSRTITEGFIAN